MQEPELSHPNVENLGKACRFWNLGGIATDCCFPKAELEGRTTCGGTVDDVCLYVKAGRTPSEFSDLLLTGINLRPPDGSLLPPGEIR